MSNVIVTIEAELAKLRKARVESRDDFWRNTGKIEGLKAALDIIKIEES